MGAGVTKRKPPKVERHLVEKILFAIHDGPVYLRCSCQWFRCFENPKASHDGFVEHRAEVHAPRYSPHLDIPDSWATPERERKVKPLAWRDVA